MTPFARGGSVSAEEREYWKTRFLQFDTTARALLDRSIATIGIGLTVLAAGAGAALTADAPIVLVFVPPLVLLLWSVALRSLQEALFLFLYRFEAEALWRQAVRPRRGELDPWLDVAHPRLNTGGVNVLLFLTVGAVSAALMLVSLVLATALDRHLSTAAILVGVIVAFWSVALVIAWAAERHRVGPEWSRVRALTASSAA